MKKGKEKKKKSVVKLGMALGHWTAPLRSTTITDHEIDRVAWSRDSVGAISLEEATIIPGTPEMFLMGTQFFEESGPSLLKL